MNARERRDAELLRNAVASAMIGHPGIEQAKAALEDLIERADTADDWERQFEDLLAACGGVWPS